MSIEKKQMTKEQLANRNQQSAAILEHLKQTCGGDLNLVTNVIMHVLTGILVISFKSANRDIEDLRQFMDTYKSLVLDEFIKL